MFCVLRFKEIFKLQLPQTRMKLYVLSYHQLQPDETVYHSLFVVNDQGLRTFSSYSDLPSLVQGVKLRAGILPQEETPDGILEATRRQYTPGDLITQLNSHQQQVLKDLLSKGL
jgi:hypothetical protein